MHNPESPKNSDQTENPWSILEGQPDDHILTDEEHRELGDRFQAERLAEAPENAKALAHNLLDTERAFKIQLERIKNRGETHISEKEFTVWEDDFASTWDELQHEVRDVANMSISEEADVENPMIAYHKDTDLWQTIEAQAGHFYHDRSSALIEAIRSSNSETAQSDLEIVHNFPQLVGVHLDFKYLTREQIIEYGDTYDSARTRAHNDAIHALNNLNSLAKKYHTRPFTPRNFWTSEVSHQTPAMAEKMRYDRDIVEEYYAIAFSNEVKTRERKLNRDLLFWDY